MARVNWACTPGAPSGLIAAATWVAVRPVRSTVVPIVAGPTAGERKYWAPAAITCSCVDPASRAAASAARPRQASR